MRWNQLIALTMVSVLATGCASLQSLASIVQPPRFQSAPDYSAELRWLAPGPEHPAGGAAIRLWMEVDNPNPFGVNLTELDGTLFLEESRTATAVFPLGLPLGARAQSTIPLDFTVSFADVPGLRVALDRVLRSGEVGYRLDGTVALDAGPLGTPRFGPFTMLRGALRAGRFLGAP